MLISAADPVTFCATYTVLYQEVLGDAQWLPLADIPAAPTNRTVTLPVPTTSPAAFYRLVIPAEP